MDRRFPSGAVFLILIGLFFLLTNTGIIDFNWGKHWPVILIALGLYELVRALFFRRRRCWWKGEGWRFNIVTPTESKKERDEIRKVLSELAEGKIKAEEAEERIKEIREG